MIAVLGSKFQRLPGLSCKFSSSDRSEIMVPASVISANQARCVAPRHYASTSRLQLGVDRSDFTASWLTFTHVGRYAVCLCASSCMLVQAYPKPQPHEGRRRRMYRQQDEFRDRCRHLDVHMPAPHAHAHAHAACHIPHPTSHIPCTHFAASFPRSFRTCISYRTMIVSSIRPQAGPQAGNDNVQVRGSGFRDVPGLSCWFGNASVPGRFITEEHITCTTPPARGMVTVVVTFGRSKCADNAGDAAGSNPRYSFYFSSRITAIVPARGPPQGLRKLTIFGISLPDRSDCVLGDTHLGPSTRISSGVVMCAAPPYLDLVHKHGDTMVQLRTDGDIQSGFLAASYTVVATPKAISVSPAMGPPQGGTIITLHGLDIDEQSVCHFSQQAGVVAFQGVSSVQGHSQLLCVSPPTTAGSDALLVSIGSMAVELEDGANWLTFLYHSSCRLDAVAPYGGPEVGGTRIQLSGLNFIRTQDPMVHFGATVVPGVTLNSTMVRHPLLLLLRVAVWCCLRYVHCAYSCSCSCSYVLVLVHVHVMCTTGRMFFSNAHGPGRRDYHAGLRSTRNV